MEMEIYVLVPIVVFLCGIFLYLGWYLNQKSSQGKIDSAEKQAEKIIAEAKKEAENLKREKLIEVKDEWYSRKQKHDRELQRQRNKLHTFEKQILAREENLDKKLDLITKKEAELQALESKLRKREQFLSEKQDEYKRLIEKENQRLEQVSGLSMEEAKKILMENMVDAAKLEAAQKLKEIRDELKANVKKEARKLIIQSIQRTASDHSVETTVSVLNIQNDEMKGRIIGREGRNIRAFEAATGIDVIVDDTPEAVILSGFDPFRREVARIALETLIADGRIHPARIEEVVQKTREELEEEIFRIGENTMLDIGLHGIHPELIKMIGKMKYRSSYGQNLLQHSIEVSWLCGIMAAELDLDPVLAKRCGLLHDIGKCVDRNTEGPHALIGYDVTKRFRENKVVVNAVGSHHEDIEMLSPYAALVQAADAISGARPGARRESLEGYVKRLEKLEKLAQSFDGVTKTYAIQAGREVRVIVEHDRVDDVMADQLAADIAAKIQQEMEYPGQIKVTVIREKRSIAYAK